MKLSISTITFLLFPFSRVLAHEEGSEITNLAEADWISPLIAILIIIGAIIVARAIRAGSSARKQIINSNQTQNL